MGESFHRLTRPIWWIANLVRRSRRVCEHKNLFKWTPESTSIFSEWGVCPVNVLPSITSANDGLSARQVDASEHYREAVPQAGPTKCQQSDGGACCAPLESVPGNNALTLL